MTKYEKTSYRVNITRLNQVSTLHEWVKENDQWKSIRVKVVIIKRKRH